MRTREDWEKNRLLKEMCRGGGGETYMREPEREICGLRTKEVCFLIGKHRQGFIQSYS